MKRKIALIHDFLLYWGGAEWTLQNIAELYPQAPIFALLQKDSLAQKYFNHHRVEGSFLQKAPRFLQQRHKWLLPLMPSATEALNLRDYDLVISSSSAFAKGVVVKSKTVHICYMHAPMRYVWDWSHRYLEENKLKGKTKFFARLLLNYLRMWDRASADRPDYLVANSRYTAQRIKKYYRREAKVIYPPVDTGYGLIPTGGGLMQKNSGSYFLAVGRLSPYKRNRLIIEAFNKLKLPLVIVGAGEEKKELEAIIEDPTKIKLIGWQPREKLIKLYQNARAFVCASEDDFNITAVEAMAAGRPVIALRRGGVTETVIEGETGEFFDVPQLEIVADGIRRFIEKEKSYDPVRICARAEEFSREKFRKAFGGYVEEVIGS